MRHVLLVIGVFGLLAGSASARPVSWPTFAATLDQVTPAVVNPKTVEFTPSADHDAISVLTGQPVVSRYELRMYLEANPATPISTTDLGKPTPAGGVISVTNPVWFAGLTPNTRYVARVAAIGPTGEGVSDASGPFGNAPAPKAGGVPVMKSS
jgi:hypothetical protein